MSVRAALEARLLTPDQEVGSAIRARLSDCSNGDRGGVRLALLQRLAVSRLFAYGDHTGCLKAAQTRSGRAFRLDVKQRVVVKAFVSRHIGSGIARGAALAAHLAYLGRPGAGSEGHRGEFFNASEDGLEARDAVAEWSEHRHHFRFIVSPEHGDRIADLRDYTRDVMGRVCADLGEPDLPWMAVCHYDTDQPHAHILMPGRRADGRDLVIPRAYVAYGFRARAQEVAQERLGDLSRHDAERRIWRETQRDGFTGFDRRLIAAMDADGCVEDAAGGRSAWAALTRGRLAHLEALGLAEREGRRFRLASDLEGRLRRLQDSKDVIRTLNQHRLESGRAAEVLREGRVSGRVTKAGFHDELGAEPFALIREAGKADRYVRLATGSALPKVGTETVLSVDARGLGHVLSGVGRGFKGVGLGN
jgi:type IV secretory pathway VirD2 relaxase